jgi:hypothetical protein
MDLKFTWTTSPPTLISCFFFFRSGIVFKSTYSGKAVKDAPPPSWWPCISLQCIWAAGASRLMLRFSVCHIAATGPLLLEAP